MSAPLNDVIVGRASRTRRGDAWLRVRVHAHALRHTPRRYLLAAWWRLLGKRVRARAQVAPLLATSPLAYRLWLLSEQPAQIPACLAPPILALVAVDNGSGIPAATMQSLALEGIAALAVSASTGGDLDRQLAFAGSAQDVWLMPMAAGDILAPGAGAAYRAVAANIVSSVIYADDDLIDQRGRRDVPHFKPAWNAELFQHFDYLTGACIVRASAVDRVVGCREDWAAQLVRSAITASTVAPVRITKTLHHRRARSLPRLPAAQVRGDCLPSVSVIVPTRNRLDLLRTAIEGLALTDYPDLDVIVVDNDSDDRATLAYLDALGRAEGHTVLRIPGPFNFSTLNNRAVDQARGDVLCLLNNDIEVLDPDWLRTMVAQAMRPDVGAVGARLLYPDGRIQHAGVVVGIGGGAAHAHRLLQPDDEGYFRRHALPQFVSAVTAACLVVQRNRFEAVGGLDEANFAVAFNDVDLCMRLNSRGWQSFYEPRATLVHHESVSRGLDRDPVGAARLAGELAALKAHWNTDEFADPFHHPQLNRFAEHFVLQL